MLPDDDYFDALAEFLGDVASLIARGQSPGTDLEVVASPRQP